MTIRSAYKSSPLSPPSSKSNRFCGAHGLLQSAFRSGLVLFGLCLTIASVGPAQAQNYPTAPIRVIVPWNAGGPNDIIARALAEKMSVHLGQSVIVEDKPGANGIAGSSIVASAKPDGYTLLLTSSAHTLNAGLRKTLPYDVLRDFRPVSLIARTRGTLLVVKADFPAKSLADYIAMAKKSPGKISYATNGVGNATHIVGALLAKAGDIKIVSVPYKGTAPFVTDILGGHIQSGFMSSVAAVPLVLDGKMRALGIAGDERAPSLPDVPTFAEAGFPEVKFESYYGLWAPARTPQSHVDKIRAAVVEAMRSPELKKLVKESDLIAQASTPDEFAAFLERDLAKVKAVIALIGIQQIE